MDKNYLFINTEQSFDIYNDLFDSDGICVKDEKWIVFLPLTIIKTHLSLISKTNHCHFTNVNALVKTDGEIL